MFLLSSCLYLFTILAEPTPGDSTDTSWHSANSKSEITTHFPASTPEQAGMASEPLSDAIDYLLANRDLFDIHSLTIVRGGHLVADVSFFPFQQPGRELHHIASTTKAVTCSLVGLAIEKGHIEGVDTRMVDFFPDRVIANLDERKQAITIEHMLTMSSGLGGILSYNDEVEAMESSQDWVQFALDQPMTSEPGTVWRYSNLNTFLLSAIITRATGNNAHDFAREHLFEPLNIHRTIWLDESPNGHANGSGGIQMPPHDLTKFGLLYLQQGRWNDQRIISESWVSQTTQPNPAGHHYSFSRYDDNDTFYWAGGAEGQRLVVSPEYDLVATFTGAGYAHEDIEHIYRQALESYILPAVLSDSALPANPEGFARLEAAIQEAGSSGRESTPVELPELAHAIAWKTYRFSQNPGGVETVTFTFPTDDEVRLRFHTTGAYLDSNFEWAAGLDGIERYGRGENDILASGTGSWESNHALQMTINLLGDTGRRQLRFNFEEDGERFELTIEDLDRFDPNPPFTLAASIDSSPPINIIPHVTRESGGFITKVYLQNNSAIGAFFSLTGYAISGERLPEVSGVILPRATVCFNAKDLFGEDHEVSHFVVPDPTDAISVWVAYQLENGPGSPAHVAETVHQQPSWRIFTGDWREIFDGAAVVNTGTTATDVTVSHVVFDGTILRSRIVAADLDPMTKALVVLGGPEGSEFDHRDDAFFEISGSQDLAVMALRGTSPNASVGYLWETRTTTQREQTRIVPHLTSANGGFETKTYIENRGLTEEQYEITPYDQSGSALPPVSGSTDAGSITALSTAELFGQNSEASHFIVTDASDQLRVSVSYRAQSGPGSPAHVMEFVSPGPRWRLFPGNWDQVFDGLAVVNMGTETTAVEVQQLDFHGDILQTEIVTSQLAPFAKALYVLDSAFSDRPDVYYEVGASQDLAIVPLRGTAPGTPVGYLWENAARPVTRQ